MKSYQFINNITDLSEKLLVINNMTNLSEELPVMNDKSAKIIFVVIFSINALMLCMVNNLYR